MITRKAPEELELPEGNNGNPTTTKGTVVNDVTTVQQPTQQDQINDWIEAVKRLSATVGGPITDPADTRLHNLAASTRGLWTVQSLIETFTSEELGEKYFQRFAVLPDWPGDRPDWAVTIDYLVYNEEVTVTHEGQPRGEEGMHACLRRDDTVFIRDVPALDGYGEHRAGDLVVGEAFVFQEEQNHSVDLVPDMAAARAFALLEAASDAQGPAELGLVTMGTLARTAAVTGTAPSVLFGLLTNNYAEPSKDEILARAKDIASKFDFSKEDEAARNQIVEDVLGEYLTDTIDNYRVKYEIAMHLVRIGTEALSALAQMDVKA